MPFFDVSCEMHGRQETYGSAGRLFCPVCNKRAKRLWSAPPVVRVDFTPGWDMGAGKNFYTKKEQETWMRESGSARMRG